MITGKDKKNAEREQARYIIVGIITAIIHFGLFQFFLFSLSNYISANIITHVIVKVITYVLNKCFVFCTDFISFMETGKEFFKFLIARGLTGIFDFFE